ncbi:flagellar hook capping FlgD N-terminal domain-containing protein [Paracoccus ravus]|uniref:flagellar hook capping FlgD N-terminal domain-containing protein n=1 Tax=Paracoccus ravus TaxID=2447760 RepID=UPI00106EBA26|nr:flagellar hook capping FlgD N-terminal domain-containing protein [Paracoccus ravus]
MVNSVSGTGSVAAATTSLASSSASATDGSDYMTFLRMLTTQVQNQDPLNPMASTDFAVQLATFSGVEQQIQTNNLLSQILSGTTGSTLAQYADWIGREVLTYSPAVYDGDPITVQTAGYSAATSANLVVRDSSGTEIMRQTIPVEATEFEWSGFDEAGTQLPQGVYQLQTEYFENDAVVATGVAAVFSEVTGVEASDLGSVILLKGDTSALVDDVLKLRSAR